MSTLDGAAGGYCYCCEVAAAAAAAAVVDIVAIDRGWVGNQS